MDPIGGKRGGTRYIRGTGSMVGKMKIVLEEGGKKYEKSRGGDGKKLRALLKGCIVAPAFRGGGESRVGIWPLKRKARAIIHAEVIESS